MKWVDIHKSIGIGKGYRQQTYRERIRDIVENYRKKLHIDRWIYRKRMRDMVKRGYKRVIDSQTYRKRIKDTRKRCRDVDNKMSPFSISSFYADKGYHLKVSMINRDSKGKENLSSITTHQHMFVEVNPTINYKEEHELSLPTHN